MKKTERIIKILLAGIMAIGLIAGCGLATTGAYFTDAETSGDNTLRCWGEPWYDTNWQYRRAITIDHTQVQDVADPSITYADFPVLVYATGLSHINANGTDIRFTLSDATTELPREIESYSSSDGTLYAWVEVTLTKDSSDSSDDVIYMYYGNASATTEPDADAPYGSENVWDSNFKAVWHLNQATGGAGEILDSTSYDNNGTDQGTPTFETAGQIGYALDFDGTSDYISVPDDDSLDLATGLTIEAWINVGTWGNWKNIAFKGDNAATNTDYQFALVTTGLAWDGTLGGTWRTKYFNTSRDTGTWIYAVVTHDTTDVKCYRAGSEISSQNDAGAIYVSTEDFGIAGVVDGTLLLDGTIDEVRVSDSARSAQWIKTCYNNQNSPSTFCSVGAEE